MARERVSNNPFPMGKILQPPSRELQRNCQGDYHGNYQMDYHSNYQTDCKRIVKRITEKLSRGLKGVWHDEKRLRNGN